MVYNSSTFNTSGKRPLKFNGKLLFPIFALYFLSFTPFVSHHAPSFLAAFLSHPFQLTATVKKYSYVSSTFSSSVLEVFLIYTVIYVEVHFIG
jgi:hypothetical protein